MRAARELSNDRNSGQSLFMPVKMIGDVRKGNREIVGVGWRKATYGGEERDRRKGTRGGEESWEEKLRGGGEREEELKG